MTAGQAQPGPAQHERPEAVVRAELPAHPASAGQARSAVRAALAAWGMTGPDKAADAELLASELVANATEHGDGPISLAIHRAPGGQAGITCEVTDTSPAQPQHRQAVTSDERGRGLAIVTALADTAGTRPATTGPGKTAWFTLALTDRLNRAARTPEAEAELEAGA